MRRQNSKARGTPKLRNATRIAMAINEIVTISILCSLLGAGQI